MRVLKTSFASLNLIRYSTGSQCRWRNISVEWLHLDAEEPRTTRAKVLCVRCRRWMFFAEYVCVCVVVVVMLSGWSYALRTQKRYASSTPTVELRREQPQHQLLLSQLHCIQKTYKLCYILHIFAISSNKCVFNVDDYWGCCFPNKRITFSLPHANITT